MSDSVLKVNTEPIRIVPQAVRDTWAPGRDTQIRLRRLDLIASAATEDERRAAVREARECGDTWTEITFELCISLDRDISVSTARRRYSPKNTA